jgi:hypothetical protein
MSDLLPCPFCGGEPIVHDAKPGGHQPVQCLNDQCCMSRMWPDIRQWQRRAALTQGEATAAPLPSSPESAGSHSPMTGDEFAAYVHPLTPAAGVAQEAGAREPVAWMHECRHLSCDAEDGAVISAKSKEIWMGAKPEHVEHYTIPLYAHPPTTGAIEAQELAVKQANLAADYMLRAEAATGAIEALRELMRANPNAYAGELLEMYDAMQAALAPPSP